MASRWGTAFLVLAAAASVLYAGGGFALGRRQGRRATAGLDEGHAATLHCHLLFLHGRSPYTFESKREWGGLNGSVALF